MSAVAKKYPKRYREYKGRRRKGSMVLKCIIALLILLLLACLVFIVFLGGRVEYTDEGVRIVMPWTQDEPGQTDVPIGSESPSPPVIVIEPPEESPEEPSPEPEPVLEAIGAVEVTVAELMDGTAAQRVVQAGGNALVVEMKPTAGEVYWMSRTTVFSPAAEAGAVTEAIQVLAEQGELYLVARVNCFRDQALVANKVGGPLMTRGGNMWYDSQGLRWVSPASEDVRSYLIRLCLELAAMGFDEILLDCAGYPYFGEVHVLATDELRPEDLSAPVEQFWQEMRSALAEEKVRMSVLVIEEMVLGTEEYSGITPELLAQYADRVWVYAPSGTDYTAVIGAERLVTVGGSAAHGSWTNTASPVK